jgi:predicted aldo/keto reductase-like oxidoreductase
LGWLFQQVPDPKRILQTKVPPQADSDLFERELATSFERLGVGRIDLLGIHGVNLPEHLEQTLRPAGCLAVARRWQNDGRIGHIGFSSHGSLPLLEQAIASDEFDYVNLHWYYIRQDNGPALAAAARHDMGIFVISPTDKGGHLHSPSQRLAQLCAPLHPIVFNDLFCLSFPAIHTISVGAARPADLALHLEAVEALERAAELLAPIQARLERAQLEALGADWLASWQQGLPDWQEAPGQLNLQVLLWLHNLLEAWDLESFARARYGLLGSGGHWFPGANADVLDSKVSAAELRAAVAASPWADQIPAILDQLRRRLGGQAVKRLMDETA